MENDLKSRREQEKLARHAAILDAAEQVFSEKGYERTSMDDIARTANLSRALLYVYFKDKSAIQRGIMLRAGESLRQRFAEACSTATTGLGKVSAIGQAYYSFYQEQPDYFAALTQAATAMQDADDVQAEQMSCCEGKTMELMVQAIRDGLDDGSLCRERIHDPLQTALYLRGALHGVVMLCQQEMAEPGPLANYPSQSLIEHTMVMLMSSIAA
ncbi:TetR/AcrR family transcriptional regulator [Marinobacter caseinilyticus]|uniref:TetR/AcrR family transcriptional regulator n=1 Tax=Marinobacter caseinilyticus TaxID=2692195 RepID=UPI00140B7450|nr:TetR/AcrR family transcriptional regulator [Marinobacter caseinilyticus]